MHTRKLLLAALVGLVILTVGVDTRAGKGGNGGGKPGGGGGDPPADPAIAVIDDGRLVVLNEDGSNVTVLVTAADMELETIKEPDWSPDGTRLVFTAGDIGDEREIHVIDVDGTGLTELRTRNAGSSNEVCWSPTALPDGLARIAYSDWDVLADGTLGGSHVYLMETDGSNPVNLERAPGDLSWSPDATRLAVSRRTKGIRVHAIDVDVDGNAYVTESPRYDLDADVIRVAWSKTQDHVLAVTVRIVGVGFEIWQIDLRDAVETSDPEVFSLTARTVLISTPEYDFDWSSDDTHLVLNHGIQKRSGGLRKPGCYVLDLSSGAGPTLLYSDGHHPAWRR